MMQVSAIVSRLKYAVVVVAILVAAIPAGSVSAATPAIGKAEVYEAQAIMNKFGIPNGPHDGLNGPNTGQGLCIFRAVTGMKPSRANLDAATLTKLREYNAKYADFHVPVPAIDNGATKSYLVAQQTCQALIYVWEQKVWVTFAMSSGRTGQETPNGTYTVGGTVYGWTCSTEFPETCRTQTTGQYVKHKDAAGKTRNYGNMYNKRAFKSGGFYIHGSNNIPTYPGSAGCIRVSVEHADWVAGNVPNGTKLVVTGKYKESDRPVRPATIKTPVRTQPLK